MSLLTKREAVAYLKAGALPDDFAERVKYSLLESCSNCDEVKDMNMVLRDWWNEEESLCDFCLDVPSIYDLMPEGALEAYVATLREVPNATS